MSLVAILKTRFLYNSDKVDIICRNGIFQPGSIDDARGGKIFFCLLESSHSDLVNMAFNISSMLHCYQPGVKEWSRILNEFVCTRPLMQKNYEPSRLSFSRNYDYNYCSLDLSIDMKQILRFVLQIFLHKTAFHQYFYLGSDH